MRRLSIARSLQVALLGLTLLLTVIAALGVASLYSARQTYEDRLAESLQLQASAGKLLAAGVVEEATLRLSPGPAGLEGRRRARAAYRSAFREARALADGDAESERAVQAAADGQQRLRDRPTAPDAPLAARAPLTRLDARQSARIQQARDTASDDSRAALIAVIAAGGTAILFALVLIAALVGAVRRPLDELVDASARLAGGAGSTRVTETGPDELRVLARSFNRMAGDVEAASARVRAERDRLDVTVRSLGDALVHVDADGRVVSLNPRAGELVPEYAVGRPAEPPPAALVQALDGEVVVNRDSRTLAVTAARLGDDAGIVWTIRDVSERARLERMKSDFVSTASHELRSPLTSIKGFVEILLAADDLAPRQREFLDIVLESTNRLVDLVGDLLDVARVEAGRLELHQRPTDLAEIVRDVTTLLGPRLQEKRQQLVVDVAANVPRAHADPTRLGQILTNLLTNAHLYTPEGGTLTVRTRPAGATRVALVVQDDGRGMSPEDVDRVFDRFVRIGDGDRTQGSGLGLAIVKSLVDLHGGEIHVESTLGKGTIFTVLLPAVQLREHPPAAREALRGRRVLVLDDEPDVARLVGERLEDHGVIVTLVHNGVEALELLRRERFDALTVDILMPGMSGFEVMREMRADPGLARLPVVVVSVFSGREALSGEWVVTKPIDADELADALGAAVLAGRVRVIAVGRPQVRGRVESLLEDLGIEHLWAEDADSARRVTRQRFAEVALVDAGLADPAGVVAALDLRGRRLPRSVVVFTADGAELSGLARLDADPVPLGDAGAIVLGLLDPADGPSPAVGVPSDG